jgi:Uma2 family endonuclease
MADLRTRPVEYPDSDGKPMADNTKQARAISLVHAGIDAMTIDDPNVFVAMDNFIYAHEGRPGIVYAPDVYVAFGRPKGDRGSYKVWEEAGIFPQIIFEVLSPNNTKKEMAKKLLFYERYGAEEYYVYDPDRNTLQVYLRDDGQLVLQPEPDGFVSPRLGIRFTLTEPEWTIYRPDGRPFETPAATFTRYDAAEKRAHEERIRASRAGALADQEAARADEEKQRADDAEQRLAAERARAEKLAALLRAAGLDSGEAA